MHMIRDATDAVAFTFSVSCDRREVGMERGTYRVGKNRRTVFRAEDNVNKQK